MLAVGRKSKTAGETYEERITLRGSSSADNPVARAEAEALGYATAIGECTYLGLAQSYQFARLSRFPLNFGGGPGDRQAAITGSS